MNRSGDDALMRAREAVAALVLPPPQMVPPGTSLLPWLDPATAKSLAALANQAALRLAQVTTGAGGPTRPIHPSDPAFLTGPASLTDPAARVARSDQLADLAALCQQALALLPRPACAPALLLPRDPCQDPSPHDAYFRLARHDHQPALGYLRGLIQSLALFVQAVADADDLAEYACVGQCLAGLWQAALDQPMAAQPALPLALLPPVTMHHRAPDPVLRWLQGHQVFAALTQGLVWVLSGLGLAHARGDEAAMGDGLVAVARLYRASAAAFRFSADFDPQHYTQTIRPSMNEPMVPAGFSGTLSVDHAHLVRLLSQLRPVLQQAQQRWPERHAAMALALNQVYQDHKWVCERFDGATNPSLRTSSQHGDSSAVDMLSRFQARRVGMLS